MPKVTYTGGLEAFTHHNNPSNRDYLFFRGQGLDVTLEDAKHYAEEATRGGPWAVEFDIKDQGKKAVEKTASILEKVKDTVMPTMEKPKRGRKGRR